MATEKRYDERHEFVFDVVQSAVALPQPRPRVRLRIFAFSSLEQAWSDRATLKINAPSLVEEVSEAAAGSILSPRSNNRLWSMLST